ncbi:MAG: hypothetical protein AB1750_09900 [Chloroflexota bacterium]
MNDSEIKPLPPPPGVVGAIKSGLDVISNHLGVLFLPLTLDLLLWLAPRLSVKDLFIRSYSQTMDFYVKSGMLTGAQLENMKTAQTTLEDIFQKFNLFSALRTFPVGVSSLMQSKMPVATPFGPTSTLPIDSWPSLLGWSALLFALGWILGGLYFNSVSSLVEKPASNRTSHALLQALLFCVGFSVLAAMIGAPVMIVLAYLNQIDAFLMQVGFFAIAMLGSWIVVPVFFAPHGIFLRGQNALHSLLSSLRMARFTLPSASMFVLAIFVVSQGLNLLWSVPNDDSWMLLVGVAGHAFVTTSLLAASFIYYRDMNAWLEIALERFKAGTAAPRA